jgi:pimeloyl-ACP methyl ester carboxylesterase
MEVAMRVVFVHGACVRDGAWWWHRTADLLLERGVPSVAPLLPSCGEDRRPGGTDGPGLPEDVAAVRQVLQDGDEPTIVVAHSYGGIVTSEAAAGVDSVRHLLLVSSYLPEVGQSLSDFGDSTPAPFLDVDPDTQAQAGDKLARQSVQVTAQPVGASAWQQVPSTYLVCALDKGTPVKLQRDFARKASTVVELDTGHHPFLSQPAAVQSLLLSL